MARSKRAGRSASLRKSAARPNMVKWRQSARQIIGMHSGNVYRTVGAYSPVRWCVIPARHEFSGESLGLHPREGERESDGMQGRRITFAPGNFIILRRLLHREHLYILPQFWKFKSIRAFRPMVYETNHSKGGRKKHLYSTSARSTH